MSYLMPSMGGSLKTMNYRRTEDPETTMHFLKPDEVARIASQIEKSEDYPDAPPAPKAFDPLGVDKQNLLSQWAKREGIDKLNAYPLQSPIREKYREDEDVYEKYNPSGLSKMFDFEVKGTPKANYLGQMEYDLRIKPQQEWSKWVQDRGFKTNLKVKEPMSYVTARQQHQESLKKHKTATRQSERYGLFKAVNPLYVRRQTLLPGTATGGSL